MVSLRKLSHLEGESFSKGKACCVMLSTRYKKQEWPLFGELAEDASGNNYGEVALFCAKVEARSVKCGR